MTGLGSRCGSESDRVENNATQAVVAVAEVRNFCVGVDWAVSRILDTRHSRSFIAASDSRRTHRWQSSAVIITPRREIPSLGVFATPASTTDGKCERRCRPQESCAQED